MYVLCNPLNTNSFFFPFIFISIVVVCAIHWHESAMDLHIFPIPIPLPLPSPPDPSGSSQCTSPKHLSHASNLGWWSNSYFLNQWNETISYILSQLFWLWLSLPPSIFRNSKLIWYNWSTKSLENNANKSGKRFSIQTGTNGKLIHK